MDSKKAILTLATAVVLLSLIGFAPIAPQAAKKIVIDMKTGRPFGEYYLTAFVGNLTDRGYTPVVARGGINSSILQDASALILVKLKTPDGNYTQAEIDAIVSWMRTGNKFLWVASDSDYLEPYLRATGADFKEDQPNRILAAIGAHIRYDFVSVESPTWNIGAAPYRTMSNISNTADPDASKILQGVTRPVMFHGPTAITFADDRGTLVSFDALPKPGLFSSKPAVFWVFKYSPDSVIVDGSPFKRPAFYSVGQVGSFPMMAGEKYLFGSSKVIVTVESPIGDYCIWNPVYKGITLDGPRLILNAIAWGLTPESEPIPMGYYGVGAVVVIIAAAAAYFFFVKKK